MIKLLILQQNPSPKTRNNLTNKKFFCSKSLKNKPILDFGFNLLIKNFQKRDFILNRLLNQLISILFFDAVEFSTENINFFN